MNPDKYAEAESELERQILATFHQGILTVVWWMKFTVLARAEAGITGTHESAVECVKASTFSHILYFKIYETNLFIYLYRAFPFSCLLEG